MDYDAIVLGGGPAGEHCAARLAESGLRVAIVERELLGGECDYWACIPSKTLLRPGDALHGAREAPGAREAASGDLDPVAALAWRDFMVSGYDDAAKVAWVEGEGIDVLHGHGTLAGAGRVQVEGREYTARDVVIATGSDPILPPVPGLEELEGVWTNREATGLTEVPSSLLVLGGGPVGVEMAQAIGRMGSAVTLVEGAERVLPREPRALGEALGEALRADGIELRFGSHASGVRFEDGEYVLQLPDGEELRGEKLLIATGRRPRTAGIGLETVGIETLEVDSRMNAGEGIWAIGDAAGVWPLTYVGKYQGRIAAANILGQKREADYEAVPRVVFTDPQAASVGQAEGEIETTTSLVEVPRTAAYTREYADKPWFMTLVSDGERLTGAYALGPEAGEWLQQATVAIRARVPLDTMADVIQPFPTFSEGFLYALLELTAK